MCVCVCVCVCHADCPTLRWTQVGTLNRSTTTPFLIKGVALILRHTFNQSLVIEENSVMTVLCVHQSADCTYINDVSIILPIAVRSSRTFSTMSC